MKAVWKGSINFALVSIPVKLYSATHKRDVGFHMLHNKCSTPLRYERHCYTCDATVAWEDAVHGYEFEKGKFVVVTDDDLESLPQKKSKSISITEFVAAKDIEPIFFDKTYYIEPEEGAEKSYALLRETLARTGRVPLAKIVFKEKEHIAAIMAHEDVLTLHTLFYADEIVRAGALNLPEKIKVEKKELDLATELVESFTGSFDIKGYRDEYRDALMDLIKAKIEGKKVKVAPAKEARKVVSLMDALKRSLKEKKRAPARKTVSRRKRKAG